MAKRQDRFANIWEYYLMDIELISSHIPASAFDADHIKQLAESIVELEGLFKPLVVIKHGEFEYSVLDGHAEYHAAVLATKINPRIEFISCMVIQDHKIIPAVVKQLGIIEMLDKAGDKD